MPGIRALLSALAAAACAVGIAACGGDDENGPIPPAQGNQLLDQLDEIEAAVEEGNCDDAQRLAVIFAQNVNTLPLGDDPELRNALVDASANLESLTEDPEHCMPTGTTGETDAVPTTTTTTPTTTTETTTPEEPEGRGPPDETPGGGSGDPGGGNNGNGNGNGNGSGEDDDSSGGIGSDG